MKLESVAARSCASRVPRAGPRMASLGLRFGRSKSSGMVLPRIDSMLAGELAAPETGPDGGASAAPAAAAVTASAAPATERPVVHRASVQPLRVNSMHSKAPVRSLSLRRVESLGPQKLRKTRLASTSSESTRRLDEAIASAGSSPPASVALSLAERSTDADTRSTASWVGAGSVGGEGGRPVVAASAAEAAAGGGRRPRVSSHAQEHWHRAMVKLHASHLFVEAGETRRERLRSIEEDAKRTRILAENVRCAACQVRRRVPCRARPPSTRRFPPLSASRRETTCRPGAGGGGRASSRRGTAVTRRRRRSPSTCSSATARTRSDGTCSSPSE